MITFKNLNYKMYVFLAFLSILLTSLAFFPFNTGWFIFFSIAPFFYILNNKNTFKNIVIGFLWGFSFNILILFWLKDISILGYISLSLYNSFYITVFAFFWKYYRNFFQKSLVWVLLECLRLAIGCGSPYGIIGAALSDYPILIQGASIGGVLLISLFVISINVLLVEFLKNKTKKKLVFVILIFVIMISFSFIKFNNTHENFKKKLKIAVIQPNITPELKWDYEKEDECVNKIKNTLKQLPNEKIDLIIFPETVFTTDFRFNLNAEKLFKYIKVTYSSFILLGSPINTEEGTFNSAILLNENNEIIQKYAKMKLVPFGEFIPFKNILPKMKFLTPIGSGFLSGKTYEVFTLRDKIFFSTLICFEDTLSAFVRKACNNDIDFLVSITNDGWFRGEMPALSHDRLARFRAIENGIPLIRCSNTGISSLVNKNGRILFQLNKNGRIIGFDGVMLFDMKIYKKTKTLFRYIGYNWIFILLLITFLKIKKKEL